MDPKLFGTIYANIFATEFQKTSPVIQSQIRYLINLPASMEIAVTAILDRNSHSPTENTSPMAGNKLKKGKYGSPFIKPVVIVAIKTKSRASELNGTTVAARKLARNNPQRLYSKNPSANQSSKKSKHNKKSRNIQE